MKKYPGGFNKTTWTGIIGNSFLELRKCCSTVHCIGKNQRLTWKHRRKYHFRCIKTWKLPGFLGSHFKLMGQWTKKKRCSAVFFPGCDVFLSRKNPRERGGITLPPITMEVKNGCISCSSYLSNTAIFHLQDYGRKGKNYPPFNSSKA